MPDFKHVGTVEILRARAYTLDPYNRDELATTIVVYPGSYPLLSDGYSHLWMMSGVLNGTFLRRGDGMFLAASYDMPLNGTDVIFPSNLFGPDNWKELLESTTCREGHPDQRLRITEVK